MLDKEKGELHIVWTFQDIRDYAMNNLEPEIATELTKAEVMDIFEELDRKYDSTTGITWADIDSTIREYIKEMNQNRYRAWVQSSDGSWARV